MRAEDIYYKKSPDTIIACCNTHGIIPVFGAISENGIYDDYFIHHKLPEDMNMIKITATALGVANISTLDNLNEINDTLKRFSKNLRRKPLMETARKIRNEIQRITKKNAAGIINMKLGNINNEDRQHYDGYRHYADNMFLLEEIKGGEVYIDKEFVKFTETEITELGSNEEYINKLLLMEKDSVDFFEIFDGEMANVSQCTFIQCLESMGIRNILFVDLSCSITTANARTNRKLKRRLCNA
jgi:hypothetical protein